MWSWATKMKFQRLAWHGNFSGHRYHAWVLFLVCFFASSWDIWRGFFAHGPYRNSLDKSPWSNLLAYWLRNARYVRWRQVTDIQIIRSLVLVWGELVLGGIYDLGPLDFIHLYNFRGWHMMMYTFIMLTQISHNVSMPIFQIFSGRWRGAMPKIKFLVPTSLRILSWSHPWRYTTRLWFAGMGLLALYLWAPGNDLRL